MMTPAKRKLPETLPEQDMVGPDLMALLAAMQGNQPGAASHIASGVQNAAEMALRRRLPTPKPPTEAP